MIWAVLLYFYQRNAWSICKPVLAYNNYIYVITYITIKPLEWISYSVIALKWSRLDIALVCYITLLFYSLKAILNQTTDIVNFP